MKISIGRIKGFSLIEIMMTFAVTATMLAFTLPTFVGPAISERIGHSLSLMAPAKEVLVKTCKANETAIVSNQYDAGNFFNASGNDQSYMDRIELKADCAMGSMTIVIWTDRTGAKTDPVLELNANHASGVGAWTCRVISGDSIYVPEECRSS